MINVRPLRRLLMHHIGSRLTVKLCRSARKRRGLTFLSTKQQESLENALVRTSLTILLVIVECALLNPRTKHSQNSNSHDNTNSSISMHSLSSDLMPDGTTTRASQIPVEQHRSPGKDNENELEAHWDSSHGDLIWIIEKLAACCD